MISLFLKQAFLKKVSIIIIVLCLLLQGTTTTVLAAATDPKEGETMTTQPTILVVGATGATGKHVVKQLLEKGKTVKVVVRSKERMMDALLAGSTVDTTNLIVKEASLLNLSDAEMEEQVTDVQAVVSCLGHNMDFKGIFGQPRRLVTESVKRLTTAMMMKTVSEDAATNNNSKPKFVLMGSDGVANPDGTDDQRSFVERTIIGLLRYLIPPHADNEQAAAYLSNDIGKDNNKIEWVVVRPTDLVDADEIGKYVLYDKPKGSLFGGGTTASRINVAATMVDLITNEKMWNQYKFTMPVMYDDTTDTTDNDKTKKTSEL